MHRPQYIGRGISLPISCLEIWSISELEAHFARALLSRPSPTWLLTIVERAIERLGAEQYQAEISKRRHWLLRSRGQALRRYIDTLNGWRFLVDLEADLKAARLVGPDSVMSLAYKTELAHALVSEFINAVIEPALDKHTLLPIANSYAAYAYAVDPHWREAVDAALKEANRSPVPNSPIVARLAFLSTLPARVAVQDPRPATSLFPNFKVIEREVAAYEFGTERIESAEDVDVANSVRTSVIPRLRDEIDRNRGLLGGKTRFEIPALLCVKAKLAVDYRPDPKFLLAPIQREHQIPYLLGAFLALSLIDEHWDVAYEIGEGVQLRLGARQVQPFRLVEQLDASEISDVEFADAVK